VTAGAPQLATCLLAEIISLTLKMEAKFTSETSVDTQQTARRYIPEVDTLHSPIKIKIFVFHLEPI
jgi:hypothetical protein